MSIALMKQSKDKLRQKSLEVENELKLDQQMLEFLSKQEILQQKETEMRKEKACSDVKWMKEMIKEQLALEKERQTELQLLYHEEAERQWKRKEDEWNREQEARKVLMNEVLEGLKSQVERKINENLNEQKKSLEEKEELYNELDKIKRQTKEEKEKQSNIKRQLHQDLQFQIEDRLSRYEKEKRQWKEELARGKMIEKEEVALVAKEKEKMDSDLSTYTPQHHRGRQHRPMW